MRHWWNRRFGRFDLVTSLGKHVTQPEHGIEWIEPREFYIQGRVVRIAALRPGNKFGVTPDDIWIVTPDVRHPERHRAVWIQRIDDAVIAGVVCEKRFFLLVN